MLFDQHMLLSLIAPRLLYVDSASNDDWADPAAEFLSACLASEVYELYGSEGVENKKMPAENQFLHEGNIAYHLKRGDHSINDFDWALYVDYLLKKYK